MNHLNDERLNGNNNNMIGREKGKGKGKGEEKPRRIFLFKECQKLS